MDGENRRRRDCDRDRVEILVRIVGHRVVHRRIDHDIGRHDQQGVAVGGGSCALTHAEIAAGAADILDIELPSERLGQFLRGEARENVGRTARRVRNDHAHRPRRVGLRRCERRQRGRRGRCGGELQKLSARKSHRGSPGSGDAGTASTGRPRQATHITAERDEL